MIVNAEARIAELTTTCEKQSKELEWYHTLKIERNDGNITSIDGGKKAQMLHEMWEENVRLKKELAATPLSKEDTGALFGVVSMDSAQQGVELLLRGKQIDKLTATCEEQSEHISKQDKRIAELEAEIEKLQVELTGEYRREFAQLTENVKLRDLCPICLTWSWAPCDEGDEGAQLRGEKWVLCQCCNDSRIAVLWKGREALDTYGYHTFNCEREEEEKGCTCGWASRKAVGR